ncbi:MAG: 4,5-DOPA dioxygenase extradiol [Melioribacteraceae bacterium]
MNLNDDAELPVLFVGHGSPMNAIEENEFSGAWENAGRELPQPKAIMCISAHWFVNELAVTAAGAPDIIYDFYGFPEELYEVKYSAPGSPEFARETSDLLRGDNAKMDSARGLDHGAWSVLCRMFPEAKIPVYQLSINAGMPAEYHFEIGRKIRALRRRGVLLIGSGNIVHNLRLMNFLNNPYDWAEAFDDRVKNLIEKREFKSLVEYSKFGKEAALSIPTPDHYYPLLYILGAAEGGEEIRFFTEAVTLGSISMRSLIIG